MRAAEEAFSIPASKRKKQKSAPNESVPEKYEIIGALASKIRVYEIFDEDASCNTIISKNAEDMKPHSIVMDRIPNGNNWITENCTANQIKEHSTTLHDGHITNDLTLFGSDFALDSNWMSMKFF